MQTKLLFFLFVGIYWSCNSSQVLTNPNDDHSGSPSKYIVMNRDTQVVSRDSIHELMGEPFVNLLQNVDSVKSLHLDEWTVDTTSNSFYGYTKLDEKMISRNQLDTLKNILLSNSSFLLDEVNKRCEFGPNLGFYLTSGTDTAAILIALNCDVIKVIFNGQEILNEDIDPARKKLALLGNSIFQNAFNYFVSRQD